MVAQFILVEKTLPKIIQPSLYKIARSPTTLLIFMVPDYIYTA
jgi:hypothetical protein